MSISIDSENRKLINRTEANVQAKSTGSIYSENKTLINRTEANVQVLNTPPNSEKICVTMWAQKWFVGYVIFLN